MARIAVCQFPIDIDRPELNHERVATAVEAAAAAGAEIVVIPELATTGYVFGDRADALRFAEPVEGQTVSLYRRLSADHGVILVGGFCERGSSSGGDVVEPAGPYNSAVVVDHGRLLAVYRKLHLWDTEKAIFQPGVEAPPVVATTAGRIALMICYDAEFPEMIRDVTVRGAQLVAVPSNWPVVPRPVTERPIEVTKAQASAAANRVVIAIADRCGTERGVDWIGGSVICDVTGYPAAGPATGSPTMLLADLDLDEADDKRIGPHNDVLTDRRCDVVVGLGGRVAVTDDL